MPDGNFRSAIQARSAAYTSWANTPDRQARTAPARAAFMARFEAMVDPDGSMRPDVRRQRAEAAKKAHFLSLAAKSAATRQRRNRADQ